MRHRISTLYAALDVSENERQLFYRHMGHSGNINPNVYQTPLAEAEILKVGSQLQLMDGHYAASVSSVSHRCSEQQQSEDASVQLSGVCESSLQPSKKRRRCMARFCIV